MRRIWLLPLSIVVGMIACDMPSINGDTSEGGPCNQKVLKSHAGSLALFVTANCPYEKECNVKFYYYVTGLLDSLKGMCFGGGAQWRLESFDTSMVVEDWKSYPISLTHDDHLRFSLFDINNVEKKYDIDLSGIIRSFTVRGDSVDVNVMKDCSLSLYKCDRETVYGNRLSDGKYTFFTTEGCDKESSYRCLWRNQGPLKQDDLNIDATIYWK